MITIESSKKFISLFSGIGGFDIAFERNGWQCVGYSEIDKYAIQTYSKHFNSKGFGNIRELNPDDLPEFDMLCAGFPCQPFSIAGSRGGFKDTKGTLFFEIARIIEAKRPQYIFLENVKGLLNHEGGKTFAIILQTLDELGYEYQWMVLNSKNFGTPQNRERVYIIGSLRGKCPRLLLSVQGQTKGNIRYARFDKCQTYRVLRTDGISSCLSTCSTGGRHVPKILTERGVRQLTPTEFERLQTFPEGWTLGQSDTQRYKQLGNAVTVNVIDAIAKQLNKGLQQPLNINKKEDGFPPNNKLLGIQPTIL